MISKIPGVFDVSPYPEGYKPKFYHEVLPSGRNILRFSNLYDAMFYDYYDNWFIKNTNGIIIDVKRSTGQGTYDYPRLKTYYNDRFILTDAKVTILDKVKANILIDPEFIELTHKAKTISRKYNKNKFSGNISMVDFASQNEKLFYKRDVPKKKATLNIAIQVGVLQVQSYSSSVEKIIKLILMCQAMNISMNIDLFDSDINGFVDPKLRSPAGYTIINVANSNTKINFAELMVFSHHEFFTYTLFNSYLAAAKRSSIEGYISTNTIIHDLGNRYDIISGNLLNDNIRNAENLHDDSESTNTAQMLSQIIKISKITNIR